MLPVIKGGQGDGSHCGDNASEMAACCRQLISLRDALPDDRSTKCWGYNAVGQPGLGDAGPRGTAAGQMGDDLAEIDLQSGC